jgi:hypothetical protein
LENGNVVGVGGAGIGGKLVMPRHSLLLTMRRTELNFGRCITSAPRGTSGRALDPTLLKTPPFLW